MLKVCDASSAPACTQPEPAAAAAASAPKTRHTRAVREIPRRRTMLHSSATAATTSSANGKCTMTTWNRPSSSSHGVVCVASIIDSDCTAPQAVLQTQSYQLRQTMTKEKLGAAIFGAGWVAGEHAKAYQACPRTRLVAVGSRKAESARKCAQYADAPDAFITTDYDALLSRPDVDVISITTPP